MLLTGDNIDKLILLVNRVQCLLNCIRPFKFFGIYFKGNEKILKNFKQVSEK